MPASAHDDIGKYNDLVARLRASRDDDKQALEAAVGGDYFTVGYLECALLRSLGLKETDQVIDVGCGSGRLAAQLAQYPGLRYLGTDVVPDLLGHARKIAARPDWRFELTDGIRIPSDDDTSDFVCFFSVFTHLTHENTFLYLREAQRTLKPGGKIVFSFLEFLIDSHWAVFENSVVYGQADHHNQFIERVAIEALAKNLGLKVESFASGDTPHIPMDQAVTWQDGRVMSGLGALGQSVAVLSKAW